jgi:flagellin
MQTNMNASLSRIQDTDVASETASLSKNQVLSQAGAAILSQANQTPQLALSLLR